MDRTASAAVHVQVDKTGEEEPSCGINFHVCANTLRGKKVSYEEDLYDVSKADIVPSGVAELAKLQAMGYTYIKP